MLARRGISRRVLISAGVIAAVMSAEAVALSDPTEIRDAAMEGELVCPGGGELRGHAPPDGNQIWCEIDGVKHGPAVTFAYRDHPRNFVSFTGSYRDGRLHGPYVVWGKDGMPWDSGEYGNGRRLSSSRSGTGREQRARSLREAMPAAVAFIAGLVVLLMHGGKVAARISVPLRPQFRFRLALLTTMWPAVIAFAGWSFAVLAYANGSRVDGGEVMRPLAVCMIFTLIEVGRSRVAGSVSRANRPPA
jgi:hypothetical protein